MLAQILHNLFIHSYPFIFNDSLYKNVSGVPSVAIQFVNINTVVWRTLSKKEYSDLINTMVNYTSIMDEQLFIELNNRLYSLSRIKQHGHESRFIEYKLNQL